MNHERAALRWLLGIAAFTIVVAGMRASASILNPFLLSVFIAVISAPPMFWLQRIGLPVSLALLGVILIVAVGVIALGQLVARSTEAFIAKMPFYQERLEDSINGLVELLSSFGMDFSIGSFNTLFDSMSVIRLTSNALTSFGGLLTNSLLITLTVIFMLLEAASLPKKLSNAFGNAPQAGFDAFADTLKRYMGIKTLVSAATGLVIYTGLSLLGVDFPLLWGVAAFLFNFVPNIGSIIAAIPAITLAFIELGPTNAAATCLLYIGSNLFFGNVVEPNLMGRTLGLSTLVVFLSLVFWGWVLGPIGMLLSVPLTVTLKIALESTGDTRWLAVLLSQEHDHR